MPGVMMPIELELQQVAPTCAAGGTLTGVQAIWTPTVVLPKGVLHHTLCVNGLLTNRCASCQVAICQMCAQQVVAAMISVGKAHVVGCLAGTALQQWPVTGKDSW